jgi:ATP-binding cassette subfamily A (ABC1) protein 3
LDEADYLGDSVAILQAPGRLLALDNPVGLKTQLGRGFSLAVQSSKSGDLQLLAAMCKVLPSVTTRLVRGKHVFQTGSNDIHLARKLVTQLQTQRVNGASNLAYQINSATLEEVFLDLNAERQQELASSVTTLAVAPIEDLAATSGLVSEKDIEIAADPSKNIQDAGLVLTSGRKPTSILALLADAYTIFLKRFFVLRRSWLLPLVGIVIVICAACIPLFFMKDRVQTCEVVVNEKMPLSLTYPYSLYPVADSKLVLAPASLLAAFSSYPNAANYVQTVADNASFVNLFETGYANHTFGGVSLAAGSAQSLFAFEGSSLENKGLSALNLLSNTVLDEISPSASSPFRINLTFRYLASPSFASTAQAFKWLAFV